MSVEDIAKKLNRNAAPVIRYMRLNLGYKTELDKELESDAGHALKKKPYWTELRKSFSDRELRIFIYEWKRILGQFNNDIMATEESQIIDLIKLGIEQSRCEALRKEQNEKIRDYDDRVTKLRRKKAADPDEERENREKLDRMERLLAALRQSNKDCGTQIKEILGLKHDLLDQLKATRDKRLKNVENSAANFSLWLKEIYDNPELRRSMSLELEKMRLAAEQAKMDFAEYHKYEDGMIDQPFLNADTIKEDNV